MPKVSIVLPIYNVSPYLHEAMESVVRQTLKDIEIICVNDGSTDDSLDIVNEYAAKDSRIIVIDKPNGGYGHAMNVGIDAATGEYLGILEPDDFLSLTMMEDLYAAASENNLDFVKADFYRFARDDNGNMNLKYNRLDRLEDPSYTLYNKVLNPRETPHLVRMLMNTWCGIYKLEFLNKHEMRHNETPGASFQDNGFFWQVQINAERAMYIEKPYYYNRRDNPNSSVKDSGKIWAMSCEYDFIRDILMKDMNIWKKFHGYYWLRKFWNYDFTAKLVSQERKEEFLLRISKEYKRAEELGELDSNLYTAKEWTRLQFIANDPKGYYKKKFLNNKKIATLKKENAELRLQLKLLTKATKTERWNRYLLRICKRGVKKIRRFLRRFLRTDGGKNAT